LYELSCATVLLTFSQTGANKKKSKHFYLFFCSLFSNQHIIFSIFSKFLLHSIHSSLSLSLSLYSSSFVKQEIITMRTTTKNGSFSSIFSGSNSFIDNEILLVLLFFVLFKLN